jgi:hypothetical protein
MKKFGGKGTKKQCCSKRKCRKLTHVSSPDHSETKLQQLDKEQCHDSSDDSADDSEVEQPILKLFGNLQTLTIEHSALLLQSSCKSPGISSYHPRRIGGKFFVASKINGCRKGTITIIVLAAKIIISL